MVAIVLLLFVSGISIIVTIHETCWLADVEAADHRLWSPGDASPHVIDNQLKQIGLAFHNYEQANHRVSAGRDLHAGRRDAA